MNSALSETSPVENPTVHNSPQNPVRTGEAIGDRVLLRDTANFVLPTSPTYSRELQFELSVNNFLYVALSVNGVYAAQASDRLRECRAIRHTATHRALHIGMASFCLTESEWTQVRKALEPLGLTFEERA